MKAFFGRYLDSLVGTPASSSISGRAREGYSFGARYWASLTRAYLPPMAGSTGTNAVRSETSTSRTGVIARPEAGCGTALREEDHPSNTSAPAHQRLRETAGRAARGRRLYPRGRLTVWLTGLTGLTAGMAVDELSGTLGYRAAAGVAAFAGAVAAAGWIRRLDPRAPLRRYAFWLFLVTAAVAAVIAAFSSSSDAGLPTVIAVALTAGAVLLTSSLKAATRVLGSAAVLGAGVAGVAVGAAVTADRRVLLGAAVIGLGVAGVAVGAAVTADRRVLLGAAVIGLGVAGVAVGAAVTADRRVLLGAAVIGLGVAGVAVGAAVTADRRVLLGAAVIGLGVAGVAVGAAVTADRRVLLGAAVIGLGVAGVAVGAAVTADRRVLLGAAVIGLGVAGVAVGAAVTADRRVLLGAAVIGLGVAGIEGGMALIGPAAVTSGARRLAESLTRAPLESEDRNSPGDNAR